MGSLVLENTMWSVLGFGVEMPPIAWFLCRDCREIDRLVRANAPVVQPECCLLEVSRIEESSSERGDCMKQVHTCSVI